MIPLQAQAIVAAVLVAWGATATVSSYRKAAEVASLRGQIAAATASAAERERAKEAAWSGKHREIEDAYIHVAAEMVAARADADAAGLRLRAAIAARRAAGADSAAAPGCQAAESSSYLYAQLFERADQRAGELAAFADAAHSAGRACQQSYDALRR